jgi:Mg2+/citrate symporter
VREALAAVAVAASVVREALAAVAVAASVVLDASAALFFFLFDAALLHLFRLLPLKRCLLCLLLCERPHSFFNRLI